MENGEGTTRVLKVASDGRKKEGDRCQQNWKLIKLWRPSLLPTATSTLPAHTFIPVC